MNTRSCNSTVCSILMLIVLVTASIVASIASAQSAQSTDSTQLGAQTTELLESLSERLTSVTSQRIVFLQERDGIGSLTGTDATALKELDDEIERLSSSFEQLVLGQVDVSVFEEQIQQEFNWQQELTEIAAPIIDSIKDVTERPRQLSELRSDVQLSELKIRTSDQALATVQERTQLPLPEAVVNQLNSISAEWENRRQTASDQLVVSKARLQRLEESGVPVSDRLRNWLRFFVLGRGLTLILAALMAAVTWLLMRALWWLLLNKGLTKHTRRKAVWFRLVSYSHTLFTGIAMFLAFFAVLNFRQDTLLMAIALILVLTALIGLRNFLPGYIDETRLLLNIGPVREEERIVLDGIPWNVESLNLQTVLRNPSLNGVIRLPIADLKNLTSRPYRDALWFPAERNDYILLPDETFAKVIEQTPEMVQLRLRGGMVKYIPTPEFFGMSIVNISRGESFGIAKTFGLDYGIQNNSLTNIPEKLKSVVQDALTELGFKDAADNLIVELSEAGASSLDYLIYAQFPSKHANQYFKLNRAIVQACVKACNENGWSIPYPQMVMHQAQVHHSGV